MSSAQGSSSSSSSSRPVTTPTGATAGQAEPLEVAEEPVLPERDLLLGLLDRVDPVAEPDDAHDVAREAAGERDDVRPRSTPRAGSTTAACTIAGSGRLATIVQRHGVRLVP